jgi:general secretion pathway protein G
MSNESLSRSTKQAKPSRDGFSFIELLIAMTIIGALAAIAIQSYGSYRVQAETNQAVNDLRTIDTSIQMYKQSNNTYPSSLALLPQADIVDPWGNPYQYLQIEGGDVKGKGEMRKDKSLVPINSDYDLYSMGPDGKSTPPLTAKASQDDIIRANNGGYFGPASNY